MAQQNSFDFTGRLTKDPEERVSQGGDKMATFTIAVDRPFAKEKTADFFGCIAWGKKAEYITAHFKKGNRIRVSGHVQNNNYKTKSGDMHYGTSFFVDEFSDFYDWNGYYKDPAPAENSAESYYPDDGGVPF